MTWPTEITCPRCGCPVGVHYEQPDPDNPYEHGTAVCPNCGLERCAGMDCWCNFADGTWWRARTP
jgi:hypothetical protein